MAIRLTDSDWISLSDREIDVIIASLKHAEDYMQAGRVVSEDKDRFLREVRRLVEFFTPDMDKAS